MEPKSKTRNAISGRSLGSLQEEWRVSYPEEETGIGESEAIEEEQEQEDFEDVDRFILAPDNRLASRPAEY